MKTFKKATVMKNNSSPKKSKVVIDKTLDSIKSVKLVSNKDEEINKYKIVLAI